MRSKVRHRMPKEIERSNLSCGFEMPDCFLSVVQWGRNWRVADSGCFRNVKRRYFEDLVVLILDGESRLSTETNRGFRVVVGRKPEIVHLGVSVGKVGLCDPHGRVPVRLSFDPHDGKVPRINPDLPA